MASATRRRPVPGLDGGRDRVRAPAAGRGRLAVAGDDQTVRARLQPDRPDTAVVDSREDADRAELHELHPAALPEDLAGALEVLAGALPEAFRLDQVGDRSHG